MYQWVVLICTEAHTSFGLSRERADKEAFYEGQGKTAGGFMHMALTTLALLNKLSAHPVIKQSFLQAPLVGSAAYNCLHFLELLVRLHAHALCSCFKQHRWVVSELSITCVA